MEAIDIKINAKTGIHARPASEIVKLAKGYKSTVNIVKGDKKGNCASIIGILALGLQNGTEVSVTAEGEDEKEAAKAVADFIASIED